MTRALVLSVFLATGAGLLITTGCQSADRAAITQTAATDQSMPAEKSLGVELAEMDRLVAKIGEHRLDPFRKPARDERDRAMRQLAEKTEVLLARVDSGDTESALTGTWPDKGAATANYGDLQASLRNLHDAARQKNTTAVAASFAKVKANCDRMGG